MMTMGYAYVLLVFSLINKRAKSTQPMKEGKEKCKPIETTPETEMNMT